CLPPTQLYTLSLHDALPILDLQTTIRPILYRPFDKQYFVNHEAVTDWPRRRTMSHLQDHSNIGLIVGRQGQAVDGDSWNIVFVRSEEHTSELQSRENLVCRL